MEKFRLYHISIPIFLGFLFYWLIKAFTNIKIVAYFGDQKWYIYNYTFSSIVQGFVGLVAFIGTLAVFKLQQGQTKIDHLDSTLAQADIDRINKTMRLLTIELMTFAVVCFADIAIALIGIPLIPFFTKHCLGPIYILGNIILSIWVLFLSYPVINKVLRLTT